MVLGLFSVVFLLATMAQYEKYVSESIPHSFGLGTRTQILEHIVHYSSRQVSRQLTRTVYSQINKKLGYVFSRKCMFKISAKFRI